LNLLAALMVLLGEETEVYSYLIPLIKLLVSVIIDKFVLCSNSDFGESVGLTPTPLSHLGKGLFLRGCIMRRRLKTQGLRFFAGKRIKPTIYRTSSLAREIHRHTC
jgi:hypothetical protein